MLSCQKQSLLKKISSWRSQGAMKTCNSSSHLQESCWKNPFNYCCIVWTNVKGRKGCWSPEFQLEIFLTRNGGKRNLQFWRPEHFFHPSICRDQMAIFEEEVLSFQNTTFHISYIHICWEHSNHAYSNLTVQFGRILWKWKLYLPIFFNVYLGLPSM